MPARVTGIKLHFADKAIIAGGIMRITIESKDIIRERLMKGKYGGLSRHHCRAIANRMTADGMIIRSGEITAIKKAG